MILRPYQEKCIENVIAGWRQFKRQLLVVPTGGGKTIIFAKLAERTKGRTLVLAHRDELVRQAVQKLQASAGIWATVEKGSETASLNSQVVVGSVQTMVNRLARWPKFHFDLIVADEAHHAVSDSWQRVLNHFNANILGVTATPDRGDKKCLGSFFENVAHEINLRELISDEFLCPIKIKALPVEIDISNVATVAGDYHVGQVASSLAPYLHAVVRSIKEHASGRKILAFLPLIETSKEFCRLANNEGLKALHVSGVSEDRKEVLARFESGEVDLLSNAMLLTEGYDCPSVDCVVVLRPTKSRALFAQMVGRGTRISPGKTDLLLLDFLWQHERHDLARPACLIAESREVADLMTKESVAKAKSGGGEVELDLFEMEASAKMEREKALAEAIKRNNRRKSKTLDAMDFMLSLHDVDLADWKPTMPWHEKETTEGQVKALKGFGIDPETISGRGHASAILDKIFARSKMGMASPKQVYWLRRLGFPNAEQATREQAGAYLDKRWGKKK